MKELWQIFWFLRFIKNRLSNMTVSWEDDVIITDYKKRHPEAAQIFMQAETSEFIKSKIGEYTNRGRVYLLTPKGRKFMYLPLGTLEVILDEFPRALPYIITFRL